MLELPAWLPTVFASILSALVTLGVAFLARRAPSIVPKHAKRSALVEFTKKRLELREQILNLELRAAKSDEDELRRVRQKNQVAIQRILADADQFVKRLEWKSQITCVLLKKEHKLEGRAFSKWDWVAYAFQWFMSWLLRIFGVLLFFAVIFNILRAGSKPIPIVLQVYDYLVALIAGGMIAMGWQFLRWAKELKYPQPPSPILDEI